MEAAHGRLAARGIWALNEKQIITHASLDEVVPRFARLGGTPWELRRAVEEIRGALVGHEA